MPFRRSAFAAACLSATLAAAEPATLPGGVDAALGRFGLDGSGLSIYARDLDSGEELVSYHADEPRNPASTMKVVTGLAALELLTPAYRWQTRIFADALPVDGIVDGNLYFVGGGDPALVIERFWLLVSSLREAGIETIEGDLVLDDSLFAAVNEDTARFDNQPFRTYNALPSAVLANFNSVAFVFRPAGDTDRVAIEVRPPVDMPPIRNRLRRAGSSCRGYRRGIALQIDEAGAIEFDGRFPRGCRRYSFTRSVMPPVDYTARLFRYLWEASGGALDGGYRRGVLPEQAVAITEFESDSLGEAVRLMGKHSSNLIARHLLLTLAAEVEGRPATHEQGVAVIEQWLAGAGLVFPELVIENGAGRSRSARITARHLVDVIEFGWKSRYMPEFVASLPLIGHDGTLRDRWTGSAMAGAGHLKTGRLDDVMAIAGIWQQPGGERLAVAILHNAKNVHRGAGVAVQDTVLEWLSSQNDRGAGH